MRIMKSFIQDEDGYTVTELVLVIIIPLLAGSAVCILAFLLYCIGVASGVF